MLARLPLRPWPRAGRRPAGGVAHLQLQATEMCGDKVRHLAGGGVAEERDLRGERGSEPVHLLDAPASTGRRGPNSPIGVLRHDGSEAVLGIDADLHCHADCRRQGPAHRDELGSEVPGHDLMVPISAAPRHRER